MPLMFLTLGVIGVIAVMAFIRTSPRIETQRRVLAFNVATLALAVPAAAVVAWWIYTDGAAARPDGRGLAAVLAIMSGGNAALLVVAVGGLVRNFLVFPLSKRLPAPPPGES